MGLARNLSKFKPSSDGLVGAEDIAAGAVTAEKIAEGAIPAGSGTNTFTASGSITAGRGVVLNSNGTVSEPTGTLYNLSTSPVERSSGNTSSGPALGFSNYTAVASNGTWTLSAFANSNTNIVYRAVRISNGTIVNTSAGYNTHPSYTYVNLGIYYDAYTQKFIHFTMTDASNNALVCRILTIDNTTGTVTVVTSFNVFSHSATDYIGWYQYFTYDTDGLGNYIFHFTVYATPNQFTGLAVINLNTNSVGTSSFGNNTVPQCVVYEGASSKWIVGYSLSGTTNYNVYTLSGTTLTLVKNNTGAVSGLNTQNADGSKGGYLPALGKTVLACGGSTVYYVTLVSDTPVITTENLGAFAPIIQYTKVFGQSTLALFTNGSASSFTYNELSYIGSSFVTNGVRNFGFSVTNVGTPEWTRAVTKLPNNGWVYVASGSANSNVGIVTSTTTTSLAWNAVGIAKQSVSNGQSVEVTTIGGVNTNVSSLPAGSPVCLNGDGTLTSTATIAPIGVALSSTSLLVKNKA
jgi:hypothetical protein